MRGISLRLNEWLHEPKKMGRFWCYGLLIIVLIGVMFPIGEIHAQGFGMTTLWNYVLTLIAKILEIIIILLGRIVIFLVDTVIRVAQYNSFVTAMPVQTGWPIVRDVINMFFIVILLVSAFSTIIGYDKYHYSTIIKKFFLMAALVNFSLPLFGVAIDFSQVLMLTFVNGFRAAAAGNFVTILKLDQVMKIDSIDLSPDNGANATESPLVQKVIAMMFGVFILGISATILAIMVVYLIARIVGLWVLLITSPGALFVTGLPSSLQGKIPGFGNDWWSKLWTLLAGGPIIAFFLWLTLATAANVGPTFTDKSTTTYSGSSETAVAENYFQTAIGSVENFGTYLVAIIMLFTGLSTAVSTSAATAPVAGKLAGKIRDYGVGSTKFLAYGGMAATAGYGVRQAGGAVGEAGAGLDRTYGITKGVGSGIKTVGTKMGWEGVTRSGAYIAGTRGRAIKKERERFEEKNKALSTGDRMELAMARRNSLLTNDDEKKAYAETWTKDAFSIPGQAHLKKQYETEAEKKFGKAPIDEKSKEGKAYKQKVEAYTKSRMNEDRKNALLEYQTAAGENEEKQRWIGEKMESMPSHSKDPLDFIAGKAGDDPAHFRKAKADDFSNAITPMGYLAAAGYSGDSLKDPDGLVGKAMQSEDKKGQTFRAMEVELKRAAKAEGMTIEELLDKKNRDKLEKTGLTKAIFVTDDSQPNHHRLVMSNAVSESSGSKANADVVERDELTIDKHRVQMDKAIADVRLLESQSSSDPAVLRQISALRSDIQREQHAMVSAGESMEKAYNISDTGEIKSGYDRNAFAQQVQNTFTEGKKDYKSYAKVNMSVVHQNTNGDNTARSILVQNANVNNIGLAFAEASAAKDKKVMKKIGELVHAIDGEGNRHESAIRFYNSNAKKRGGPEIDLNEVTRAAKAFAGAKDDTARRTAQNALQGALKTSGLVIKMDEALAIAKRQEIQSDPILRNVSNHASDRTKKAWARVK